MPFSELLSFHRRLASVPVAAAYLFLVRSMKRLVPAAACLSAIFTFASCESVERQNYSLRVHYPSIAFYGSFASQLSVEDVRQIVALAQNRKDVIKPIIWIDAKAPDKAEVVTGKEPLYFVRKFTHTQFIAYRKNGLWQIDEPSVKREEVTGVRDDDPET